MKVYDQVVELAKRRGFFWPSFSIYGGESGLYDYGPLGVLLRDNIVRIWKESYLADDAIFIDTPVIVPASVFRASGHLDKFADLATECSKCHNRQKLETVLEASGFHNIIKTVPEANEFLANNVVKCIVCGNRITSATEFKLMFRMPSQGSVGDLYLRPETAQGIFVNFKLLNNFYRNRLPMAVAQLGKGFRNEISPRQSLIRLKEFSQGEVEVFVDPQKKFWKDFTGGHRLNLLPRSGAPVTAEVTSPEAFPLMSSNSMSYFIDKTASILRDVGINLESVRFRQVPLNDLAHYSSDTWDVEVRIDDDWVEVVGIADRNDLTNHEKSSGETMSVKMEDRTITPSIIEPSYGIDRIFISVMIHSFRTRENGFKVLSLPESVSPYHAAVFPLVNKDGLDKLAESFFASLRKKDPYVVYDQSGSIGRRYARQDEIGTPYCITFDSQTLQDSTVTVRERDSAKQVRFRTDDLVSAGIIGNPAIRDAFRPSVPQ